ncbi:MAG: hypothetical protein PUI48_08050 [Oscillospiraceae bacterium]|nr:hypothetical protein [Oscillospiraceae bacterium]MDY6207799.1 hypothetical protein [Oscillospiraceae bacterium]
MKTSVADSYTFTYATDISGGVKFEKALDETRELFKTRGLLLEDFSELKLINNTACWELYIVISGDLVKRMPDTEYEDVPRQMA